MNNYPADVTDAHPHFNPPDPPWCHRCDWTMDMDDLDIGMVGGFDPETQEYSDLECPQCGGPMQ